MRMAPVDQRQVKSRQGFNAPMCSLWGVEGTQARGVLLSQAPLARLSHSLKPCCDVARQLVLVLVELPAQHRDDLPPLEDDSLCLVHVA